MFAELTIERRKELYDKWLSQRPNPITSNMYRSNISTVSNWLGSKRYDGTQVVDIYACPSPSTLIHIVAALLVNPHFLRDDHNRNYSTPLRRYLEWVYDYISKNNEMELVGGFLKEIEKYRVLSEGNFRLHINHLSNAHTEGEGVEIDNPNPQPVSPRNRILYGAPGTGKSHHLMEDTSGFPDEQVERVTFHPEYTYFDFVGSYRPTMINKNGEEVIAYRFEAGPFAKTLKKALLHRNVEYYLVIEEINRARAAAVFGDLFQLLDRNSKGRSEYGITPAQDLANYLTKENEGGKGVDLENGKLYLPEKFFIWATMNSADQGVFPLDTAFKRRWCFEYIPIDNNEDKITGHCGARWNTLRKHVNALLQASGINEDKQLGAFFLKEEELADEKRFRSAIKEKVIMYLYEDAARHQRKAIFKDEKARFSELCEQFDGTIGSIFKEVEEQ